MSPYVIIRQDQRELNERIYEIFLSNHLSSPSSLINELYVDNGFKSEKMVHRRRYIRRSFKNPLFNNVKSFIPGSKLVYRTRSSKCDKTYTSIVSCAVLNFGSCDKLYGRFIIDTTVVISNQDYTAMVISRSNSNRLK